MHPDWMEQVDRRLVDLETQNAVNAVHRLNVSDRLTSIEDTLKWLVRLIVGGLIVSMLTYVVQGNLPT